jgi:basic amino acid/polyamine antiporter, APA family
VEAGMSNISLEMADVKLKKGIHLWTLVAIMIGINVGGSLFVLTGVAAGLTGPSLILAQVISTIPILLALIPYFTLSSAAPATCANYQYAKLFSKPMACAAWMTLFIAIPLGALPLFAIATGNFIQNIIPGLHPTITALTVMVIFYIINLLGIKPVGIIQFITVIILLGALILFIVPGLPKVQAVNLEPFFAGGIVGFLGAAALVFTLMAGGLFGIEIGGEVHEARSTIPKALMISMGIVLVIYLLLEFVAVGVMDFEAFAKAESLRLPAEVILSGGALTLFIVAGGVLACVTTISLILTIAGRYVLAFAYDGYFPKFFTKISKKYGTPHWGLTLAFVLTIIMLMLNYFFSIPLIVMGQILNFGLLFMITLVLFAAMRLPKTQPEMYAQAKIKFSPALLFITSLLAIIINIIFMAVLAYGMMTSDNAKWAFPLFLIAIAIGIVVYYAKRKKD